MRCKNCDGCIGYASRKDFEDNKDTKELCDYCEQLINSSLLINCQDYIECMGSGGGSGSSRRFDIHNAIAIKLKVKHLDKGLMEITDNLDKYLDWSNFVLNEYMVKLYGKKLHDLLIKKFGEPISTQSKGSKK